MSIFNGKRSDKNPTGLDLDSPPTETELEFAKKLTVVKNPGYNLPEHYLEKMSKGQIANWCRKFFIKEANKCATTNWGGSGVEKQINQNNCVLAAMVYATIENANMAYINGYVDFSYVEQTYSEGYKFLAALPLPFPSFKEQLKNSGKFLVGIVAGLITGGPVGLFTGAAASVKQMVDSERAKKEAQTQALTANLVPSVQQAAQAKEQQQIIEADKAQQQQTQKYISYGLIAVAVGIGIYTLTD